MVRARAKLRVSVLLSSVSVVMQDGRWGRAVSIRIQYTTTLVKLPILASSNR